MELNQLLSACTNDDKIDLKLLTEKLFNEEEQAKIWEHIKATS